LNVRNTEWKVIREREKGKPILSLETGNRCFDGSRGEIQDKINSLIGLDFRSFCNSVLYGQGDINRFISATDSVRKSMLNRILGLDVYKQAERIAKDRSVTLKEEISELENKREIVLSNSDIIHGNIVSIKKSCDEWEQTQNNKKEVYIKDIEGCKEQLTYLKREKGKYIKKARKKIEEVQKDIEAVAQVIEKEFDKVNELNIKVETLFDKLDSVDGLLHDEKLKIDNIKAKLSDLEGDVCPVCNTNLGRLEPIRYKTKLEHQLSDLKKETSRLKKERSDCDSEYSKATNGKAIIVEKIEGCEYERQTLLDKLEELESSIEHIKSTSETEKQKIKHSIQISLGLINKIVEDGNPYEKQLKDHKVRYKRLKLEVKELGRKITGYSEELSYVEFWIHGFGSQGLPSMLLDSVMPYLTERTNHYLGTLTDSDIVVEFSTQKELKSGDKRDKIDVSWVIEGVPNVKPSGGQKRKIEIATDLALMDLVSTKKDFDCGLLLMDEVLDGLDGEGVSRILQLLQDINKEKQSIFVITHESSLSELFEKTISVTKYNGVTRMIENV